MRVTSLGSGSSGNAYLIEAGPNGRTRLLVDAGFPPRLLSERLRLAKCAPHLLRGVLITHEHSDHILGLPFLLKRHQVPVYADSRTLSEIRRIFSAGEFRSESGALINLDINVDLLEVVTAESQPETVAHNMPGVAASAGTAQEPGEGVAGKRWEDSALWRALPAGTSCVIGDIQVRSFPVSHDAAAPCGYVLSASGCRVCIITDSGEVTPAMLEAIAQADLLILESNHDRERLIRGPYPYYLKERILSPTGHLSNVQAATAVLKTWRTDAVRWLWLAHLSRTNNTRNLALTSMRQSVQQAGASLAQLHISVLSHEMGGTWDSARLWHDEHLWTMP